MKIFISKSIPENAKSILEEAGYKVDIWNNESPISKDELISKCQDKDALISMLSDRVDADFFNKCPTIKAVSNYAVGYNNIEVDEATKRNIAVGNTPDVLTEATADLAFALLMDVSRNISSSFKSVRAGQWKGWEPLGFLGVDLRGKTLGIFGAGRIGKCMAKTCHQAFGMKIIYTSRSRKEDLENECQATKVSFEELLESSDVISLHCNLNENTKNLFNKDSFRKMKEGAIFINTARGEMHDEKALFEVLESNHLYGAGLDVTNPEPMQSDSPLLQLDNIVVTPHIGSATTKARNAMAEMVANNIINALNRRPLIGDVNNLYR